MPRRREITQAEMLEWLKAHATVSGPQNTSIVDPETEQVHKLALTLAGVTIGGHTFSTSLSSGHGTHEQPGLEEYGETLRRITLYLLLDRARNAIIEEINGERPAAD
jgi:hypothetical protein